MKFSALSEKQVDILREVSNIGVGHAATALSQMIGHQINMCVPSVRVLPFSQVPEMVGGAERPMAGVYCRLMGDVTGYILLIFPSASADALVRLLLEDPNVTAAEWSKEVASSIGEIGNILASSYLNALGSLLRMTLIPSIPSMAYDMAGITDPLKEIDVAEISEEYSYQELLWMEGLGFCGRGEAGKLIDDGVTQMGGQLPVNPSGGMLSGNPTIVAGAARAAEAVLQLRGEAGDRQVPGASVALAHGVTGICGQHQCVSILTAS